ncbi:MAG: homocysteine S-methyltransferase [Ilumatobacteraceae bacterium]
MTAPARPEWIIEPFTVVDGGLSTALEALGHRPAGHLWTAQLVAVAPDLVVQAHRGFVEAGADVVISASYQASVPGFERAGLDRRSAHAALASTTTLARRSGARFVAASIGPFGAVLGDGSEYSGRYDLSWEGVRAFHRERLVVLADTAPDLFAIETIPSRAEAEIVLDELARVSSTPAWLSTTCADGSHTWAGDDISELARHVGQAPNLAAFGINCTHPRHVPALLRRAAASTSLPLVAYPNHGRDWDGQNECWIGNPDSTELADEAAAWAEIGARVLGGCCGVGVDGIARLARARAALASIP